MNDSSTLTLCGNIGTDPRTFLTARGLRGLSFRLGVTAYRVTDAGAFQSLDTRWYTVRAFDKLAENLLHSLHKGQPVIVIGRPGVNAWKDEGGEVRSEIQITASHVGLDLKFGTAHFWRTPRHSDSAPPTAGEAANGGGPSSEVDEGGRGPSLGEHPGAEATSDEAPAPGVGSPSEVSGPVVGQVDEADGPGGGDSADSLVGGGVFEKEYAPF